MPKRDTIKQLSKQEIGRIRSNLSRRASLLGNRLTKNGMGELEKEMTAGQIKSAAIVLSHVLPGQQSMELTEIADSNMSAAEMKARINELRQDIVKSLTPGELAQVIGQHYPDKITPETGSETATRPSKDKPH